MLVGHISGGINSPKDMSDETAVGRATERLCSLALTV